MRTLAVLFLLVPAAHADDVDALIADLTKDASVRVRLEAAQKIAELGDEADRAIPALLQAFQRDPDYRVQMASAQTMGKLRLRPRDVLPVLDAEMRKQLKKPEGESRNYGVIQGGLEALRSWGNDAHESLPVVLFCLKSPYKTVRTQAARAAGAVAKTDREVEQAVKALKTVAENDPEKEVRDAARAAAKTLAEP